MGNDSVKNLVTILKPLIEDLEEKKEILSSKKAEQEKVSRLLAYVKDNVEMVGIYADQDIITESLDKLKISVEDYKASCYLLKTDNESVKLLPQYEKACDLIYSIIDYFKLHKSELILEVTELEKECDKKELDKKYYDILSCPNPLIENTNEYIEIMKNHGLNEEEIINALYMQIHYNITNYELKSN